MNFEQHNSYFENIAAQLKGIEHSGENKHFATIDTMEVIDGLRNKISGNVFYLDKYYVTWEKNGDTIYKIINGAFNIVRKVSQSNYNEQDDAINWAEGLVEQVNAQMIIDSEGRDYIFKAYFGGEMLPLSNKPLGYYGMRQEYQWKLPYGLCKDPSMWEDGVIPEPEPQFLRLIITDQNDNILSNTQETFADVIEKQINIEATICDPATITLNQHSFLSLNSGETENITLVDEDDNQVTPVSIEGSQITLPKPIVGYQRDPNWLTMPEEEENTLIGLYLVFEDEDNTLGVQADNNVVEFDFGDGTVFNSDGNNQFHTFDYSTISSDIHQYTEDGGNRNYKQVFVKVKVLQTSNGGILRLDIAGGINVGGSHNFADILCDYSNTNIRLFLSSSSKIQSYLRILKIKPSLNGLFFDKFQNLKLQVFETPNNDILGGNNASFQNSTLDCGIGDVSPSNASVFQRVRIGCIRNILSTNATAFNACEIGHCRNINLNTGLDVFWNADINITGTVNCTYTNFRRMFTNCTTRQLVFSNIPSNPTNIPFGGGAFSGMKNLQRLVMPGLEVGFDITNSNMTSDALLEMANSLGNANGSQTITTIGNPGALDIDYRNVLTGKGYTVVFN